MPQTGLIEQENEEASVRPVGTRDRNAMTLRDVVTALNGATAVSRLTDRAMRTVQEYIRGEKIAPPEIVERLESLLAEHLSRQSANLIELSRIKAEAKAHKAEMRRLNRERYYARFGRYPVPARGGKTP